MLLHNDFEKTVEDHTEELTIVSNPYKEVVKLLDDHQENTDNHLVDDCFIQKEINILETYINKKS